MTVKELIEKLSLIENKDLPVSVGVEYGHTGCFAVSCDVGLSVDPSFDEPCGIIISGVEDEDSSDW